MSIKKLYIRGVEGWTLGMRIRAKVRSRNLESPPVLERRPVSVGGHSRWRGLFIALSASVNVGEDTKLVEPIGRDSDI